MPAQTFDDVLSRICRESTSAPDLGAKLERIMLNVLREDRLYKNRFDRVWTRKQWARENNVREEHGTGSDLGVDLAARKRVGG